MSEPPATTDCRDVVELVTDYLEGALDAATRARFEQHLRLCHGCAAYLSQIEETAERLGRLSLDPLPAEARARLLEAFRDFER